MAGATWDMITSGPGTGQLIQPLQYTETDDDATRVELWLSMATPQGKYVYKTNDGLDHAKMLAPTTSDEERQEDVRDILLAHERVVEVVEIQVITDLAAELPSVAILAEYTTESGETQTINLSIGA